MAAQRFSKDRYHLWNPYTDGEAFLPIFGFASTIITRGEGPYLYNHRGKRFISGNSSLWNAALGIGRPELEEAIERQLRELPTHNCWYTSHPRAIELAARLVEITDGYYNRVYLGSNGTEAVETALKIARQYFRQSPDPAERGRHKLISLRGSYHGFSFGAISLAGSPHYEDKYGPLMPGFVQVEPPYCYRCPFGTESCRECGLACANALEGAIRAEGPETVAALILEPVMGDHGVIVLPDVYIRRVGEICDKYGLLLIADEVTTGFGRTGKLFASDGWARRPDIICLGKAISGGYQPMAATLATEAIYRRFVGPDNFLTHGSTNSGHPLAAAVSLAAIDIIVGENLAENAAQIGDHLYKRFKALMDKHEIIGDVRGRGLMLALELVEDRQQKTPLSGEATFAIGTDIHLLGLMHSIQGNQLRFFPPLIIDRAIADEMVDIVDRGLTGGLRAAVGRRARLVKEFALTKTR